MRLHYTWLVAAVLVLAPTARAEWKAGVSRVKITPQQPMWMSGYASRERPAEGTLHDLWAKALALEDGEGHRAVLVTMDLCGVDRHLSEQVTGQVLRRARCGRADIALCVSHTHTGPVVGGNLRTMYFLDDKQRKLVDDYAAELEKNLVSVACDALDKLVPARLEWGVGRAGFAVNRRNNREEDVTKLRAEGSLKGPVDHDLPVLTVRSGDGGKVVALVFGYACHATTLQFYQWSGDWPGFAQIELEKMFPGGTALFVAGCGADQNPLPRRTVQLAQQYGSEAASGAAMAINSRSKPVGGPLRTAYSEIELPFAAIPTREQLQQDTTSKDRYVASRAKFLLETLDRDGRLSATYPYPVQVWRFGSQPTLVLLGGEVVVDYSLRLKKELGPTTWVAGYANDVMAYIPSLRILKEGGYEGGGAMVYYGLPSPWGPEVEERIVSEVHRLTSDNR